MNIIRQKFKKGAASFYIVAISTLILLVVVMSFAAIIVSELERTSNEDLSQSAYDSAMAGVEDAKLAYNNYRNCIAKYGEDGGGNDLCKNAISTVKKELETQECSTVANILQRPIGEKGVLIQESSSGGNNMQQYYTCVKLSSLLKNYEGELNSSQQTKVVKVKLEKDISTSNISQVRISWYDGEDSRNYKYNNLISSGGVNNGKVVFPSLAYAQAAAPPTISLAMVQTGPSFSLSDFDMTQGDKTNRGMVYLVPTNSTTYSANGKDNNYNGAWNGSINAISADGFRKSNDKTATNLPYAVYCSAAGGSAYACSATIDIPEPVGGARNDDTFMFVVGLPYGKPSTAFSMEFLCGNEACGKKSENEGEGYEDRGRAYLDGVQVEVDSTGLANDLYRRLKVRLDAEADSSYLSIMGPLELTGTGDDSLKKNLTVKCEYNFNPTCS